MKKRRPAQQEDRRRPQVEINLAGEDDGPRNPLVRRRSGCGLPFLGGVTLLVVLEVVRALPG